MPSSPSQPRSPPIQGKSSLLFSFSCQGKHDNPLKLNSLQRYRQFSWTQNSMWPKIRTLTIRSIATGACSEIKNDCELCGLINNQQSAISADKKSSWTEPVPLFINRIRILSCRNGCGSFWSAVEGILHFFPRERDGVVRKLAVCSAVKNIEGSDARKRRCLRNLPVVGDEKGIEVADSRCRWFCLLYAVIRGAGW